ncbi:hypothetical protein FQA39_LY01587 [Lamprigera yunnana]|nr:hypothetical protein FQA39_LY01587 [Lamprigera yunnana]
MMAEGKVSRNLAIYECLIVKPVKISDLISAIAQGCLLIRIMLFVTKLDLTLPDIRQHGGCFYKIKPEEMKSWKVVLYTESDVHMLITPLAAETDRNGLIGVECACIHNFLGHMALTFFSNKNQPKPVTETSLMDKELLKRRSGHDFTEDVLICSYHSAMLMTKYKFLKKTCCNPYGKDNHAIKKDLRTIDISDADELKSLTNKVLNQAKSFAAERRKRMDRHEGVSCDSCHNENFKGKRYKCLICYDYDLCSECYETGITNTRHKVDHPMQCIITRADFDLYYGGEHILNYRTQSYTCPCCSRMGFTEVTLHEHVIVDHPEISFSVICPICSTMPGGNPNLLTDHFSRHLTVEHSSETEPMSFLEDPVATSGHNVRRVPNSENLAIAGGSRSSYTSRLGRSNMHFSVFSSGGSTSLSSSSREPVDPLADVLYRLCGARREAINIVGSTGSTSSQLHQLQMHMQLERQVRLTANRSIQRKQTQGNPTMLKPAVILTQPTTTKTNASPSLNFLLAGLLEECSSENASEDIRADRSQFVQELIYSTLVHRKEDVQTPQLQESTVPITQK